jgi:hypothetical protein
MAGLAPNDIADFVETTNKATLKSRYQDIVQKYNQYEFAGRVVPQQGRRKKATRYSIQGTGIQWFVGVVPGAGATKTGLYAPTTGTNVDHTKSMTVQMAMGRSHWQYDDREAAFQGTGVERLLDYLSVREDYANRDYVEFMEDQTWLGGSSSSSSPPDFIGLVDWFQKYQSSSAFGFNGGNPTNWSAGLGGLSRSTYTGLKNGTAEFTVMNDNDLFPTWEEAMRKTRFVPPISYAALVNENTEANCIHYTNNTNIKEYNTYLTLANDNLRVDAGRYRGMAMFKQCPVCWVPALDADTDRPIYSLNWDSFEYVMLPGYQLKRNRPFMVGAQQEHVWRVVNDWIGQWICYDPRLNTVITWTATQS